VVPAELARAFRQENPGGVEVFSEPMPFVVEVWSPSTGMYGIDHRLPGYQARGDQEIWRVHPFDRMVTVWRRRPDGSYEQVELRNGKVPLFALPGVSVDLDALFESFE
jgi:Uma2 family endonuclease